MREDSKIKMRLPRPRLPALDPNCSFCRTRSKLLQCNRLLRWPASLASRAMLGLLFSIRAQVPSFPPQRESSAFSVRVHVCGNGETPDVDSHPIPSSLPQHHASYAKTCVNNKTGFRFPMRQKGRGRVRGVRWSPVIPDAARIQSPDYLPRRLCQPRGAGWTGRRPNGNIPANTNRVGCGKGPWIPVATRITMASPRPHMST